MVVASRGCEVVSREIKGSEFIPFVWECGEPGIGTCLFGGEETKSVEDASVSVR